MCVVSKTGVLSTTVLRSQGSEWLRRSGVGVRVFLSTPAERSRYHGDTLITIQCFRCVAYRQGIRLPSPGNLPVKASFTGLVLITVMGCLVLISRYWLQDTYCDLRGRLRSERSWMAFCRLAYIGLLRLLCIIFIMRHVSFSSQVIERQVSCSRRSQDGNLRTECQEYVILNV